MMKMSEARNPRRFANKVVVSSGSPARGKCWGQGIRGGDHRSAGMRRGRFTKIRMVAILKRANAGLKVSNVAANAASANRTGHREIDTLMGRGRACVPTIVDRRTGLRQTAEPRDRAKEGAWKGGNRLIRRHPTRYKTIASDNGCEFHGKRDIEETLNLRFFLAAPHHSWARGANENTQWPDPTGSPEEDRHEGIGPETVRPDRRRAQQPATQAMSIPHFRGGFLIIS